MNTKQTVTKKVTPKKPPSSINGNGNSINVNQILKNRFSHRPELENKIKLLGERAENTVMLGFEKAVANIENPSMYPMPTDPKTVERAFHKFLMGIPNSKRNKMMDKINETLNAGTSYRNAKYKDLVNVDFKSSVAIVSQVKAMPVPEELLFTEDEGNDMAAELKRMAEKPKNTGYATSNNPQPQQAVAATKMGFFVDSMTCLNPDDVRKDEISIAGFSIDIAGITTDIAPRFVGKFKKNETVSLGANNKLFTLNIDPAIFPQSFIAGLFIIESDIISDPDTVDNLVLLFQVMSLTLSVITMTLIIVSAFVVPVISVLTAYLLIAISGTLLAIGIQFIPLLGDDISFAVTDTLTIVNKVDIGLAFPRTLTIGKGFDINSTFDGKYTAQARWVGEA